MKRNSGGAKFNIKVGNRVQACAISYFILFKGRVHKETAGDFLRLQVLQLKILQIFIPLNTHTYVSIWCFVELSLVPIVRKQFAYEASLFDKLILSYYAPAFHVTAVDGIPSPHKHCLMGHLCL